MKNKKIILLVIIAFIAIFKSKGQNDPLTACEWEGFVPSVYIDANNLSDYEALHIDPGEFWLLGHNLGSIRIYFNMHGAYDDAPLKYRMSGNYFSYQNPSYLTLYAQTGIPISNGADFTWSGQTSQLHIDASFYSDFEYESVYCERCATPECNNIQETPPYLCCKDWWNFNLRERLANCWGYALNITEDIGDNHELSQNTPLPTESEFKSFVRNWIPTISANHINADLAPGESRILTYHPGTDPTSIWQSITSDYYLIAAFANINDAIHFYRRDSDGNWSHKKFKDEVINTVDKNSTIALSDSIIAGYANNPSTIEASYKFIGYFTLPYEPIEN